MQHALRTVYLSKVRSETRILRENLREISAMATAAAGKKKEKKKQQPPLAKTRSEEDYTYRGLTRLGQQYGPVFRVDMGYW